MTAYTHTDSDGDKLQVVGLGNLSAMVSVENARNGRRVTVSVPTDAAPAVALAILEKAGADAAAAGLRALIAEAEDEAKLDAEAVALFEEYRRALQTPIAEWGQQYANVKDGYRAIARKARELHQTKEA